MPCGSLRHEQNTERGDGGGIGRYAEYFDLHPFPSNERTDQRLNE